MTTAGKETLQGIQSLRAKALDREFTLALTHGDAHFLQDANDINKHFFRVARRERRLVHWTGVDAQPLLHGQRDLQCIDWLLLLLAFQPLTSLAVFVIQFFLVQTLGLTPLALRTLALQTPCLAPLPL